MNNDYTHISVILDRTGSMDSIRDDIIGGFNAFLGKQKQLPGKATLTLVQFDSQDPYEVLQQFGDLQQVPELTRESYVPRASTPLLDAMGRGINDLEARLAALPEAERPAQVMVVIITDGMENASREFRRDQVRKMIDEKSEVAKWQFVFLSADLDAIRDAESVGFKKGSTVMFSKTEAGTRDVWNKLGESTADFRSKKKEAIEFDEEDTSGNTSPDRNKKIH